MKLKITIILSLLMLLGCSLINGPSKPKFASYNYPLEVGNSWIYERTITHINIDPDTSQLLYPRVMKGSAEIQVSGTDTLGSELELYVLNTVAIDSMNPQFTDSGTFLFRNEEDGLYEYGNYGSNMAVPVSRPPTKKEITDRFSEERKSHGSYASSANNVIKQSLKYPINLNSSWTFLDSTNFIFGIEKKIIRYEQLKTAVGSYNCFVVEWIYTNPDISVIDYISEIGLMKRTIIGKDLGMCSIDNSSCVIFDMIDEYNLVEFSQAE